MAVSDGNGTADKSTLVAQRGSRSMWTTQGPSGWPAAPVLMSFTALRDIEECPRRWALRNSEFPKLWQGRGYPPAPTPAALAGQVVHRAIELIVRAVAGRRDQSEPADDTIAAETAVVNALRSLGGISSVLETAVQEIVSPVSSNPRVAPHAGEMRSDLLRRVPTLRTRVQGALSRLNLAGANPRAGTYSHALPRSRLTSPAPMSPGLHAEVPVISEALGWCGKVDLLRVAEAADSAGDEITDFKTGKPRADHAFQARVYALLWARDKARNPSARLAHRLALVYDACETEIPPPATEAQLASLEAELAERTATARAAVAGEPPAARLSNGSCTRCDVRHMCNSFWESERPFVAADPTVPGFDAGVLILQRQGSWSWVARLRELGALSTGIPLGSHVLLRARPHDDSFCALLHTGMNVRVVGSHLMSASDESGGLPVLALTRWTELYEAV